MSFWPERLILLPYLVNVHVAAGMATAKPHTPAARFRRNERR
jgi:hypothetical protein